MNDFFPGGMDFLGQNQVLSSTQRDWFPTGALHLDHDMIHRTIATSSAVMSVKSWPMAQVAQSLKARYSDILADLAALTTVVNFQRKYINYQATYSAFLLGTLSEEEFEQESDAFLVEERSLPPEEIAPMIERIDRLLDFSLTDREIGEYLEVDRASLEAGLSYLRDKARLLHANDQPSLGFLSEQF